MGLEGTLRDSSVTDIFQGLGLQRKTGVLTVEGREDTITVSFLGGQILSAESTARTLEERVGNLLLRAGKLTQEDLSRALEAQKETKQRLGVVLVRERLVSPEDLGEALRLQISRLILGAFPWTEGRFRFSEQGVIDYDAAQLSPVSTDSLLMEAVQFLDEWPAIENKIPSRDMNYRRAPGGEHLRLVPAPEEAGEGTLVVSRREAEIWKWVDGKRRVGEVLERAFLSDLDAYLGLCDLLDRSLIVEGKTEPVVAQPPASTAWASWSPIGLWGLFFFIATLAFREAPRNPLDLSLRPPRENQEAADLLKSASLGRLATIERAVRVYYDSSGRYPRTLEDLLAARVLSREAATDPYGRPYRYILRTEDGKFSLYGRNARGDIDLDLSFERSLAPVAEFRPDSSVPRPEKEPGVHVVR